MTIQQTNSSNSILKIIKNQPQDTLLVFDVNNVLSILDDIAIQQNWRILDKIESYCKKINRVPDGERYSDSICLQAKRKLVEKEMYSVIEYIKNNSLSAIALTHSPYGEIESI